MSHLSLRQFFRDVLQLAKPRIILLLAITCICGALVGAKGNIALLTFTNLVCATLGLVLSASGANMVNMWWDRDIDPLMNRTKNRPLPQKRWSPAAVLTLGSSLIIIGALVGCAVNLLTGAMALSGALFYVLIYTMLLKRHTVHNIVIGGAAGAFPPLVGWAAVQNDISSPLPWLMFAIIFFWTPPHFWALALMTNADYTRAKIPMYPVVYGEDATRLAILRYLTLLVPVTLLGGLFQPLGGVYILTAAALGLWWSWSAIKLLGAPPTSGQNRAAAQIVFTRSLYYLALVFFAMVVDSWL